MTCLCASRQDQQIDARVSPNNATDSEDRVGRGDLCRTSSRNGANVQNETGEAENGRGGRIAARPRAGYMRKKKGVKVADVLSELQILYKW